MSKKYSVTYTSGATGYGWHKEYDKIEDFESFVDEIRNELLLLGHKFYTNSDTEVILKAYVQWKDECVNKFNGIFAFAIWDEYNQNLYF